MKDYRMPAEWEKQELVQLTWPHMETDWAPILDEITETYVAMAREITKREPLLIVVPDVEMLPDEVRNMDGVTVFTCPTNDTWARDHAFLTLIPTLGNGEPLLLDFRFNGWGKKFPSQLDNAINGRLLPLLSENYSFNYEQHDDFVLEGGAIESDGKGTVFTTSTCLMAPNRNQPLTQEDIEDELKRRLRADRIVWLDHGHLVGDDTDGHIDTIVRLAPNDTIVYVGCDNTDDEQWEDFQVLEKQLQELRTMEGEPYRLLRLPMPAPIYDEGERLPATYANFLVLNGAVLVPTYGQAQIDAEALRIIGEAFPRHEIVGLDSCCIIRQHGSIHCCTMQYPSKSLR